MVKLTDAEWIVMKQIWQSDEPICLSELIENLREEKLDWKPNTIRTFLVRLEKKGAVEVLKERKPFKYKPKVSREICETQAVNSVNRNLFNGSISRFISALLATRKLSDQEYEELRQIISKYRNECEDNK